MLSRPVSDFETSSRSPVSCAWRRTFRSIDSNPRLCVVASSFPVRIRWSQPSTAFNGVRSSCEIVPRNSSFSRLAASVSCRAACASPASRSAARRARRSSATSAVSSTPCPTKSARWVSTARDDSSSVKNEPSTAPSTVTDKALRLPATQALASTAVPSSRNRLPSSMRFPDERYARNTMTTMARATKCAHRDRNLGKREWTGHGLRHAYGSLRPCMLTWAGPVDEDKAGITGAASSAAIASSRAGATDAPSTASISPYSSAFQASR